MCIMEKNSNSRSGAALVIAVAAAAVVLLSASLLLGYLGGMLREQGRLELLAQARLSQASAVDWLRWEVLHGMVPDSTLWVETGGMVTEIVPGRRSPAPPLALDLGPAWDSLPAPVPCPGGVAAVSRSEGGLVVSLLSVPDLRQAPGYPLFIEEGPGPILLAGFSDSDCGYSFMLALKRPDGLQVYLAGLDGSLASATVRCPGLPGDARASAGLAGGQPVLLVSGSGAAYSISLADARAELLQPLPGTCPVFLDGRILCVPPDADGSANGSGIVDVLTGDFDQDGEIDAAWAAPEAMTVWLSSRQAVLVDRRQGCALAAWGVLEQLSGLACRWESPDGSSSWSRLSWTGFQEALPSGPMRFSWQGRIESGGNLILGVLGDSLVMASAGGSALMSLGSCTRACWGAFEGGTADVACSDGDAWRLVLDPEDGGGLEMPFVASTSRDGETLLSAGFTLRLYSGQSGARRVYAGGASS
jgi:hypothetical protein